MKSIYKLLTIALGILLLLSNFAQAKAVVNNEHQAVVDTALNYFNGVANGDQKLLSSAFDFEFGHIKMPKVDKDTGEETIKSVPLKEFAAYFEQATKDTWTAKILAVDIVDDKMAMVKLDFQTSKSIYTDYLLMYKRNGSWKIVNKTFVEKKK